MTRTHWKTQKSKAKPENPSDLTQLESKMILLRLKVLGNGSFPANITEIEKERYLMRYSAPTNKKQLTAYQRAVLTEFWRFIENPNSRQGLKQLNYAKSAMRSLQRKQRATLVKVVTTLMFYCDVTTLAIGIHPTAKEQKIYEIENGKQVELMQGVSNTQLMNTYQKIWNEKISKTRWFDAIKLLKLAEFLEVEACYLGQDATAVKREELRNQNASKEEIESIPQIYSIPAYKYFTHKFLSIFGLESSQLKKQTISHAIKRKAKELKSSMFAYYSPNSDFFWTKKRKEYLFRIKNTISGMINRYPQSHKTQKELIPI